MSPLDPQIIERIAESPRKYRITLPSPGLLANAQVSLSSNQKKALIFVGIVALALSVLLLLSAQARPAADVIAAAPQSNSEPSSTTAPLVIDVQGEVVNPGLYEVPLGSRVGDAIKAAGGVRKGVSTSSSAKTWVMPQKLQPMKIRVQNQMIRSLSLTCQSVMDT